MVQTVHQEHRGLRELQGLTVLQVLVVLQEHQDLRERQGLMVLQVQAEQMVLQGQVVHQEQMAQVELQVKMGLQEHQDLRERQVVQDLREPQEPQVVELRQMSIGRWRLTQVFSELTHLVTQQYIIWGMINVVGIVVIII